MAEQIGIDAAGPRDTSAIGCGDEVKTSPEAELAVALKVLAALSGVNAEAASRACAWAVARKAGDEKNAAFADLKNTLRDAMTRDPFSPRPKPS